MALYLEGSGLHATLPMQIAHLERLYTFRDRARVLDFLSQHPFLTPLLEQAVR